MNLRLFILFVSLLVLACQGEKLKVESNSVLPKAKTKDASAARQKEKNNESINRDTLWHWEVPTTVPAFLFANRDSANTWSFVQIDSSDYARHRQRYLAQELFKAAPQANQSPPDFYLATSKYYVAFDRGVKNPNWVSKDWYYFYGGYAPKLNLHFAGRSRIVGQGLLIDSISGHQFVLNSNYDGGWQGMTPTLGRDRFLLWSPATYDKSGFSLVQVELHRLDDELKLKKTGQYYSEHFYPLEVISLNRDTWAMKCLAYNPSVDPNDSVPATFYFKSSFN